MTATHPQAPAPEAAERAKFEAHFGSALDYRPWPQTPIDSAWFYDCTRTEYAWRGWKAGRSAPSAVAQAPAQAGEVAKLVKEAKTWIAQVAIAGHRHSPAQIKVAVEAMEAFIDRLAALATQPLAAPVQQEAEAVTAPQVGETWHILRPGAWACARVKIHAISKLTVTFESTTYGVPNEVIPLNFGLRFVERIDATPPAQPVLAPVVREPLTADELLLWMRIPVDAKGECPLDGHQRSLFMARGVERACAEAWGITLAAHGIQATTGEQSHGVAASSAGAEGAAS